MGSAHSVQWNEPCARDALAKYSHVFGAPAIIDMKPGGIAVWNAEQISKQQKSFTIWNTLPCIHEIAIKDEAPKPHLGCVYVSIKLNSLNSLPARLRQILIMSDTLSHNERRKVLLASCSSIENCIAILKLASDILLGISTLENARLSIKPALIQAGDKTGLSTLYATLCKNVAEYNSLIAAADIAPPTEHMIVHNRPKTPEVKAMETFYVRCPVCSMPQTCLRGAPRQCSCGFMLIEKYEGMPCASVVRSPNTSLFDSMNPELHVASVNDQESITLRPEIYGNRAEELSYRGSTTGHPQWLFGENTRVNGTRLFHNVWASAYGNPIPLSARLKQAHVMKSNQM